MNEKELKLIQEFVKNEYDKASLDYKTFDGDIDMTLTYLENKNNIVNQLKSLLPVVEVPKLKRDCAMEKEREQELIDKQRKEEQEKQEAEAKARLDKELESITKDSKELEKLYKIPIEYIEMVAKRQSRGLLLYGESSLGKSYRVKEVLKRLEVKEFSFISGHITPLKFYEKLFQAREGLVIFDDVNILDNLIILNMIKASLNENSQNVVEYHTTKKMNIPSSVVFNGQVIILLNDIPKRNEHLKAIESRVLKYHLQFTREEILKIIFEIAQKKEIEGTTILERIEIAKWIKDNTNRATQNLNIRLYLQAVDFYKYDKENWKELTSKQIQNDEWATLIIQGCSPEKWVEETGLSITTMDRIRRKMGLTRTYGVVKNG